MLSAPQSGDVLITDAVASQPREFALVDALTRRSLGGTFPSLHAAVTAARKLRDGCGVWRENTDKRGRVLGPPLRLPVDNDQQTASVHERRRDNTQCPRCGKTEFDMIVRGTKIAYACHRCSHEWIERRASALHGPVSDAEPHRVEAAAVRLVGAKDRS
jgi:hypothetical protein